MVIRIIYRKSLQSQNTSKKKKVSSNVDEDISGNFIFLIFFMKGFYTKKARSSNIDATNRIK